MDSVSILRAAAAILLESAAITKTEERDLFDESRWDESRIKAGKSDGFSESATFISNLADSLEEKEANDKIVERD